MSTPQDSELSLPSIPAQTILGGDAAQPPPPPPDPSDPNNPPWGVPIALLTWFLSVVFLWIIPQLCALPYVIKHYRGVGATKETLLADKTFVFILVAAFIPVHLLTLALAWVVATKRGKYSLKKVLGWSWPPRFGVAKSAGLALLLFGITAVILARFGGQETDFERLLMSSRATAVILAIVAATTAPLVEEIIYRGLLYSALHRAIGSVWAVVVVTSMFAGLHVLQYWPNFGAISAIVLLSLILTIVRARTGRLLPCFVIHLVFNGVQSVIIIFEPYLRALYHLYHPEPVAGVIRFFFSI